MKTFTSHLAILACALSVSLGASADPAPDGAPPEPSAWRPPTEASPRPAHEDWAAAQPLPLRRPHPLCTASVIREWVRIACKSPEQETYFGVRVLGGPHDDVRIADLDPEPGTPARSNRGTDVVFPLRLGDRRLLEIGRLIPTCWRCYSIEETTEVVISALWLDAEHEPVIVVI